MRDKPSIQVNKVTGKFRLRRGLWVSKEYRTFGGAKRALDTFEHHEWIRDSWSDAT